MYRIAICIMTRNREELVRDFLESCADHYTEAGIDICVYDSSDNDDTRRLVTQWQGRGRLLYSRLSPEMSLYEKELLIFREHGEKQSYDFISLSNDATQFSREDMNKVLSLLDRSYDFVVYDNEPGIGTRQFTDPEELFMTYCEAYHLGSSMVNVHTMLRDVDWESYRPVFGPGGGDAFLFYYRRFLELDSFRALHVEIETRRMSALKKDSYYNSDNVLAAMNVVHSFEGLPDYYKRKWELCRRFNSEALMGGISDFVLYRKQGTFNLRRLLGCWKMWDKMTFVPRGRLLLLAMTPRGVLLRSSARKRARCLKELRTFCDRHAQIAVYGAGNHGAAWGEYLSRHGIAFDFYCVTKRKPGKYEFMGHPVRVFDELGDSAAETGFIVALSKDNTAQVLPGLRSAAGDAHVFYDPQFETEIREETGYQAYSAI